MQRLKISKLPTIRITPRYKKCLKIIAFHFILPISIGTMIYLLFRPLHLTVFHWAETLGLYNVILNARDLIDFYNYMPEWVIYSLPNGLWSYSFMFFISFIWGDVKSLGKIFFIFIVIALSVGSELGQLFNLVPGAFCLSDVFTYSVGLLLGYCYGSKYPKGGIIL